MQQTKTYKLNLIETSDTFSPDPLNENTEKLEAEVSAEAAARQSSDAALEARVTVLEARRFVAGTYKGNGIDDQLINLGFTPIAVLVQSSVGTWMTAGSASPGKILTIQDGGFTVGDNNGLGIRLNSLNGVYPYLASL